MFKPFYIHELVAGHNRAWTIYDKQECRRRGFSVYIEPSEDPFKVKVKHVFCNPHDEFNKKIARKFLAEAQSVEVFSRSLDKHLAALYAECLIGHYRYNSGTRYSWVYKYLL